MRPCLFISLYKAKITKNGTLEISLGPRVLDLRTLYIWNQSHLVTVLSTYMATPLSAFMSGQIRPEMVLAKTNPWNDSIGRSQLTTSLPIGV